MFATDKVVALLEKRNNARKEDERDKVVYASALGFASYAVEEDLAGLFQETGESSLFHGTLEPGQLLYTPGGMVAGEQILSDGDHFGCRVPIAFFGNKGDSSGTARLRSLQMEAQDSNRKNVQLDMLLERVHAEEESLKKKNHP